MGCFLSRSALVAACLVLWQPLRAQQAATSATLGGSVVDVSNAIVSGIDVAAADIERGRVYSARTDSAGRYHFMRLQPGRYRVSIDDPRFQNFKRLLTLTAGQALDP
jgi:hypothetical protein